MGQGAKGAVELLIYIKKNILAEREYPTLFFFKFVSI